MLKKIIIFSAFGLHLLGLFCLLFGGWYFLTHPPEVPRLSSETFIAFWIYMFYSWNLLFWSALVAVCFKNFLWRRLWIYFCGVLGFCFLSLVSYVFLLWSVNS